MNYFHTVAHAIRHSPGLRHANWLWNRLRPIYHTALNLSDLRGHGIPITLNNGLVVRIPGEFTGLGFADYETESIQAFSAWVRAHPDGMLLDVGCSIAFFSLVGLTLSQELQVLAFDADLASLKASQRFCHQIDRGRLRFVHGLLVDSHPSGQTLDQAVASTAETLRTTTLNGDPKTINYVYLDKQPLDGPLPRHSLDGLLMNGFPANRPSFLKCDVEGAELLVLRGAEQFLRSFSPRLLVSVHPKALPNFGHTTEDVRSLLVSLDYNIQLLAMDHEEHWLCERKKV